MKNTDTAPVATGKLTRSVLLALVVAGIVWGFLHRGDLTLDTLESRVHGAGIWGPLVFMAIYAIGTLLFLPGAVLTLAGGALFGPIAGTFYNLTGATVGATLAFLVARYLASDYITQRVGGRARQLIEGVEAEGWRFIAFVRLVPLFPFNVLNYALGLTRIKLSHYIITSYIAMLPGALAYTWLGYAGHEALAGDRGWIQKSLLALGLLAVALFLPRLVGSLRRGPMIEVSELQQRLNTDSGTRILDVRSAAEFTGELGHIAGAQNIPVNELSQRIAELDFSNDTPVALVCRTDKRSAQAARQLGKAGFTQVVVVRGGMVQWNTHHLPVATDQKPHSTPDPVTALPMPGQPQR